MKMRILRVMGTRQIKKSLREIGLDDKETNIYLAALSLGDASMTDIADHARVKRSTAYKIFDRLKDRGLMGSYKMRSGLRFTASKPDVLLSKVKNEVRVLEEILPELKALDFVKKDQPRITVYEGFEGYRTAIEDSLKKPRITLRHIGSWKQSIAFKHNDYDLKYYLPKRIEQKINLKSLYFREELDPRINNDDAKELLREVRYLPPEFMYESTTLTYEDKVIIASSYDELVTVMIQSKSIAKAEQQKFDLLWKLVGKNS